MTTPKTITVLGRRLRALPRDPRTWVNRKARLGVAEDIFSFGSAWSIFHHDITAPIGEGNSLKEAERNARKTIERLARLL